MKTISSSNPDLIRKAIENKVNILEIQPLKSPSLKKSNFNDVLARLAAKNKVAIGINLERIKSLEKREKAQALSAIKQNIKILRKANTQIAISNNKARFLLLSLGASTKQAHEAQTQSF